MSINTELSAVPIVKLMKTKVVTVTRDDSVVVVMERMAQERLHALPVIDQDERVVGIVSEGDFFVQEKEALHIPSLIKIMERSLLPRTLSTEDGRVVRNLFSMTAADIMRAPCVATQKTATVDVALRTLITHRFKTLPVVDEHDHLVGIVTLLDLVQFLFQGNQKND